MSIISTGVLFLTCSAIEDFPMGADIDKFQYNFNRQCSVKRSESKDFVQGSPLIRHSIIDFWDRHWGDHKEVKWATFSSTFYADYNETIQHHFGPVSIKSTNVVKH